MISENLQYLHIIFNLLNFTPFREGFNLSFKYNNFHLIFYPFILKYDINLLIFYSIKYIYLIFKISKFSFVVHYCLIRTLKFSFSTQNS